MVMSLIAIDPNFECVIDESALHSSVCDYLVFDAIEKFRPTKWWISATFRVYVPTLALLVGRSRIPIFNSKDPNTLR